MLEARIDDEVEYVEKKWDEFVINGVKLYNYFSPRLVELNGEKTEDIVLREALNALDIFFKKVKELHGKV
jgi:hypothetical protein